MSMFKLQIVLVPPRALDLQTPDIPVNSTPNNSMNWQNNSNTRIRIPSFNITNNSMINNNEVSRNLRNMRMKLNQMIAYRNYLFQKNCKKFLIFINLQSDLNDLADEILIKFNKMYPAYTEDLNILTIQDINGNDLDPEFIIKDVFNTSNVVKVLIDKDIDWNNSKYFSSKFGNSASNKRRKLNSRVNSNLGNTTMINNNSNSLRFTTPMVHEIHRDIDSIMMDKSMDKSMDRSILPPPSKPQAPQIRISSGVDHSRIISTGQAQLDAVSKSEIVDPDKSRQHILTTQQQPPPPIVLADQSSPKGTLLGTPVMTVITPNKLTASEQKNYSTSNIQLTDTVIHHSPNEVASTINLPPPLKTPGNNTILPFTETNNIEISTNKAIETTNEVTTTQISHFERPSALSKAMRDSLQRQQSTIANARGSPVKNGPLSDDMADNVHLAELPQQQRNNIIHSIPQPVETNSPTKSILEKIMEQQHDTNSTFNDLTNAKSNKKEVKKRQIINHNNYIPGPTVEEVTNDRIENQITENIEIQQGKKKSVSKDSTVSKPVQTSNTKKSVTANSHRKSCEKELSSLSDTSNTQPEKLSNGVSKTVNKSFDEISTKENVNKKHPGSNIATHSSEIRFSDIADKWPKSNKSIEMRASRILNKEIAKVSNNSSNNETIISQSQPAIPSKSIVLAETESIPTEKISASQPLSKSKVGSDKEANTSVGNNSFNKTDLLRMFENNNFNKLPWLSKSHNSTAHRVIGKSRTKPYLTVLNKDIDNSKPDPRNILPSRTPRNAAQKATLKLSGQTSMIQDEDILNNDNQINGSEEFESYSESGGEYESSGSSGIMTDVSSDEEDMVKLAKSVPNVPVKKVILKESIVNHGPEDSDKESDGELVKDIELEVTKNNTLESTTSAKAPIQSTKPSNSSKATSNMEDLLNVGLSHLEASISMSKGKNLAKPVEQAPTHPNSVKKAPISPNLLDRIPISSNTSQINAVDEPTPLLANTITRSQYNEGNTTETLLLSNEADESSSDKNTTIKPSNKQSKPKRPASTKDRKTAAFMGYLNHPKVGEDLLLDLDSTDSADNDSLSSSSESEISIKEIKTVPTPLNLSKHGSDLYDNDDSRPNSPTNKSRSSSSMLHSIQPNSSSHNSRTGLEAITNTSNKITTLMQKLNSSNTSVLEGLKMTGSRDLPSPMSISIAPSSDAVSDHEIDNDIPETSSDYESSGVELDD